MSAKDLARVGLLVATRGVWKGKRLISDTRLVAGHDGGNAGLIDGRRDTLFSWGEITARGISPNGLKETIVGPVRKTIRKSASHQ